MLSQATHLSHPGKVRRRLWVSGLALACIAIAVIAMNVRDSVANDDGTLALGHDLLPSYAAGELVRTGRARLMYDASTVRQVETRVRSQAHLAAPTGSGGTEGFGPWLNPPFFAWCFVPLSMLPYRIAAGVFLGVNLLLLGVALTLLGRWVALPIGITPPSSAPTPIGIRQRSVAHLESRARRWSVLRTGPTWPRWGLLPIFMLTCMPFWQAMCHQQNTFISLVLLAASVAMWRQRRAFAAGCCIGLLFFKPQLAAAVALALAIDLGLPAVAGLALVGTALLVVNLLTLPGTITDYLHQLPPILHWLQNELPYNWGRQVTFQSFWRLMLQGQHAGDTLRPARFLWCLSTATTALLLIAASIRTRNIMHEDRSLSRDRLISLTIIAMPLLMPYYMDYDLLLLAIPATLFARQTILRTAPLRWVDRVTFWSWVALFLETQINPGLAGQTRLNLAVPILFGLFLSSAAQCWKREESSAEVVVGMEPITASAAA